MPSLISTIPSTFQLWFTLAVILGVLLLLAVDKGPPHFVMLAAIVILWNADVITVTEALAGFGNPSMLTVAGLFVTVGALDRSRIIQWLANRILGRKSGPLWASAKLQVLAFILSAFTNNIPMQALMLPIVCDWCRSRQYPSSQFLLPMNYANIMGGMLATIGTSTNLVVNGLLETQKPPQKPFAFFEPGYIGLPIGIIGMAFMLAVQRWMPDNSEVFLKSVKDRTNDVQTAFELSPHSSYVGKPIADVLGLCGMSKQDMLKVWRRTAPVPSLSVEGRTVKAEGQDEEGPERISWSAFLKGYFTGRQVTGWNRLVNKRAAAELGFDVRASEAVDAGMVALVDLPDDEKSQAGDIYVMQLRQPVLIDVVTFYKQHLLVASEPAAKRLCDPGNFVEAVVGLRSPLVGQPVRFAAQLAEKHYGAGLVAVRLRHEVKKAMEAAAADAKLAEAEAARMAGEQEPAKSVVVPVASDAPEQELAAEAVAESSKEALIAGGDRLFLLAPPGTTFPKKDFILTSTVAPLKPPVWFYDVVPVLLFVAGVTWASFDDQAMIRVSVGLFTLFVLGGWIPVEDVRTIMEWDICILIGTSLALGTALSKSGLANALGILVRAANLGPQGSLFLLTAAIVVLNEIVTNNAAATLGIPVAVAMAKELKLASVRPFAMAVLVGGSAAYACPIGYATHMMVMGPGNYTLKHFLIFGIPLDIIYIVGITVILPWIWPL